MSHWLAPNIMGIACLDAFFVGCGLELVLSLQLGTARSRIPCAGRLGVDEYDGEDEGPFRDDHTHGPHGPMG